MIAGNTQLVEWSLVIVVGFLIALALKHDTWLVAAEVGDEIVATATTTDVFFEFDNPIRAARIARITCAGVHPRETILMGDHTVFRWGPATRGVVEMSLHPHPIELERDAFAEYLRHEGAWETHAARVADRNHEHYAKHAKALIPGHLDAARQPIGQPLEIVRSEDAWQVLLHGEPIDREVTVVRRGDLVGVRAHLIRYEPGETSEWQSLWATLTYRE